MKRERWAREREREGKTKNVSVCKRAYPPCTFQFLLDYLRKHSTLRTEWVDVNW